MKTLKELKGVKELSKTEQKAINGGRWQSCVGVKCAPGYECVCEGGCYCKKGIA